MALAFQQDCAAISSRVLLAAPASAAITAGSGRQLQMATGSGLVLNWPWMAMNLITQYRQCIHLCDTDHSTVAEIRNNASEMCAIHAYNIVPTQLYAKLNHNKIF